MICHLCTRRFTKQQARNAVSLYDGEGRLSGYAHHKCVYVAKKRGWIGEDGSGRYFKTSPSSWDQIRKTLNDVEEVVDEEPVDALSDRPASQ